MIDELSSADIVGGDGFQAAFDDAPSPMLVLKDGLVIDANTAAVEYLGYLSRDDLACRRCDHRAPGPAQAIAGANAAPDEVHYQHQDGHRLVASVSTLPVVWGGAPADLEILVDQTARRRLHDRPMVADRMVCIGTLAAGIAHEINNPLTYILGNLEAIQEDIPLIVPGLTQVARDEIDGLVGRCLEGVERVRVIVKDLRTFARADEDSVSEIDIHAAVESALQMVMGEVKQRAKLVREFGDPPRVLGNFGRLTQVAVNLIMNAAQAMTPGAANDNEIRIRTSGRADGWAVLEVRDTGVGIPPDIKCRVFDPFFTTKSVGDGTGLGLAVAHNIITTMGGKIEVDSEVGLGTVFRILLPGVDALAGELRDESGLNELPRSASILVVDDEPGILDLLGRALRGHDLTLAHTGREALELCSRQRFDLVVCDLQMPEVTGMDVHRHLLQSRPEIAHRMIFMTGGAFTSDAKAFLSEVPNEVLEKPFGIRTAQSAVEAILARPDEAQRAA